MTMWVLGKREWRAGLERIKDKETGRENSSRMEKLAEREWQMEEPAHTKEIL